ncbi:MAG: hypothetical protein ACK448_05000 [Bacteroidota bacterium]|jgi:hypothetical protein
MLRSKWIFPTTVLILCSAAVIGKATFETSKTSLIKASDTAIVLRNDTLFYDTLTLSLKKIPSVMAMHHVATEAIPQWANIFTAVKIIESGVDGQYSKYSRLYNNLVGMRFPRSRKTTAVAKSKTNYSIYASWYDCILDFGLYLDGINRSFTKKNGRPTQSDQEMVRYLYGIYNTNVRWRNDVLKVLEKIQDANQPAVPIREYNDPALSIPSDN